VAYRFGFEVSWVLIDIQLYDTTVDNEGQVRPG
jgi:hypothetical protein